MIYNKNLAMYKIYQSGLNKLSKEYLSTLSLNGLNLAIYLSIFRLKRHATNLFH